jgi:hypothetical protein
MWPWFIGVAMVGAIGVMCVFGFRMLKGVKDKVDRGDARWEDDWDPFS